MLSRDWDNTDDEGIYNIVECEICDEDIIFDAHGNYLEEVSEFDLPYTGSIIAHTMCGRNLGLRQST
jgi:hypothetical protein